MANRRFEMYEYRQVLVRMRQGRNRLAYDDLSRAVQLSPTYASAWLKRVKQRYAWLR